MEAKEDMSSWRMEMRELGTPVAAMILALAASPLVSVLTPNINLSAPNACYDKSVIGLNNLNGGGRRRKSKGYKAGNTANFKAAS
jgi:hypothetical protein